MLQSPKYLHLRLKTLLEIGAKPFPMTSYFDYHQVRALPVVAEPRLSAAARTEQAFELVTAAKNPSRLRFGLRRFQGIMSGQQSLHLLANVCRLRAKQSRLPLRFRQ